ncbi:hypothetical protein E2C01_079762 [Portunus trituberculatus]|uniref:Uncharacterized protein n=1 Tax=Portunus trituberculatus TaxID=210409 RepID=A0A5B7IXV0_PORTR|nr:hypothetical protein [Portunus trituberculatus]
MDLLLPSLLPLPAVQMSAFPPLPSTTAFDQLELFHDIYPVSGSPPLTGGWSHQPASSAATSAPQTDKNSMLQHIQVPG